ncbi:MAG: ATP-dependent DNA helicase RecG [Bacteroidia bacterium]|nr:ATP-dependent DNA helicase RecG [Bacteroidia bacterium]
MSTTQPSILDTLSVTSLPGVGSHRARALETIGIRTVADLLYHFPRRYLDRSTIVRISELYKYVGEVVTVVGVVARAATLTSKRKRFVVTIADGRKNMEAVFFQGLNYWQTAFTEGETLAVSGTIQLFGRNASMVHPDIDRLQDEESLDFINTGGIVPVYPSGADLEKVGLNRHGGFRKLLHTALQRHLDDVRDWAPVSLLQSEQLQPLRSALENIHRPQNMQTLNKARERLIYDEFFLLSMQLALRRRMQSTSAPGIAFSGESPSARRLVQRLPFELTRAQRRVLREIVSDMRNPHPMNRLLQGDVGSGKTVVALLAMLVAVDSGHQCALMVPTEILAEQHYRTITSMVDDLNIRIRLLTGQQSMRERSEIFGLIAGGGVDIVVGTHALIQDGVEFNALGLVVIDEQHRFGVAQRASLRMKGATPDALVMTATPIPRTLSMTLYGDLDVSVIDELPAHRKPVRTAIRFENDRDTVEQFIREEVGRGNQAYIVFPLVSESEKLDLKAANEEYERLRGGVFADLRLGLLHGQMKTDEKDDVMMCFKRRELDILVSTTVIEVGVDVPDATVMLIEHAERFGLAQLHQLRGRVGRSEKQAYCILMTDKRSYFAGTTLNGDTRQVSDVRRRLDTMQQTTDGFRIAEVDMEIRGPGDLWGTQQSGFPVFRLANLLEHGSILQRARAAAFDIVERDPQLRLDEHTTLRTQLGPKLRTSITMLTVS